MSVSISSPGLAAALYVESDDRQATRANKRPAASSVDAAPRLSNEELAIADSHFHRLKRSDKLVDRHEAVAAGYTDPTFDAANTKESREDKLDLAEFRSLYARTKQAHERLFTAIDEDGNGRIDWTEAERAKWSRGKFVTADRMSRRGGDLRLVSPQEFSHFMKKEQMHLARRFSELDKDADHRLSFAEGQAGGYTRDGMRAADVSPDSQLSREEFRTLFAPDLEAFYRADEDGNGAITAEEARAAKMTDAQFEVAESGGAKSISRAEYMEFRALERRFDRLNTNGGSTLDRGELAGYRKEQIDAADNDPKDGKLSIGEFKRLVGK